MKKNKRYCCNSKCFLFEQIVMESTDCLMALDCSYKVIIVNHAMRRNAKRILGMEVEEGSKIDVNLSDKDKFLDCWQHVLQGDNQPQPTAFLAASNEPCELRCYPLHDEGSRITGAYALFRFIDGDEGDTVPMQCDKKHETSNFETLAEHLPHLVFMCTPEGIGFWWNEKCFNFTGLTSFDQWLDCIHPEDKALTAQNWLECVKTGHSHEMRHRIKFNDGTWRWMITRAEPIRDKEGKIERWLGTCTDIEDFMQAQTKLSSMTEQLNLLMAAAHFGVWSWDLVTDKVEVDDNILQLYGIERKNFNNTRMELVDRIHPDDKLKVLAEITRSVEQHDTYDEEFRVIETGKLLAARGRTFWDNEGKPYKMVGINWDITQKKKLEKERLKALEYAEEQARQRVQEAQEHHKRLEEFVDTICHEIRNPLNGICGMLSIMQGNINQAERDGLEPPVLDLALLKEGLETLEQCAQQQRIIVDDVLDLSKVEQDKLELDPTVFNPKQLLESVGSAFQGSIKQKKLQLQICCTDDANCYCKADTHRLSQILMNLLCNSIKFTSCGTVSMSVSKEQLSKQHKLNFTVADTGIGMDSEELTRLFNKFTQAHPGIAQRYGGSGLGLVISKKLVERMGGRFEVQSEKGKGTCFKFSVLCEAAQQSEMTTAQEITLPVILEQSKPQDEEWNLTALKVLIVEDSIINQKILTNYMNQKKCYCQIANNGLEAVNLCAQSKYDVIFMDLEMPIMGGLEATRKIREPQCLNHNTLIIGLSGNARQEHKDEAIKCGMDEYLTKPFHKTDIYKTVMQCCRCRRQDTDCCQGVDAKRKRIN